MPRPSLPPNLKRLETMNVLLTKTTEEEVWAHMTQYFKKWEAKMEEWIDAVYEVRRTVSKNTFANWNWRKGSPKLYYKKCSLHEAIEFNEDDMDSRLFMMSYVNDLHKCKRGLKWDKDSEYAEEFNRMMCTVEYLEMRLKSQLQCLADDEDYRCHESKRAWQIKDAPWIEHKAHKQTFHTCVYCVDEHEKAVALKKRQDEYEAHEKEQACLEEEVWEAQETARKAKEKEELERRRAAPVIQYNCDLCKYKTTSLGYFTEHGDSKEHKLKLYYCKLCGVQSRTENEFNFHCSTVKHRTKGGEVIAAEPEMFRCEPCSYVCGSKLLWKQHCAGKKHLQKTDVGKDKEQ